MPRGARRQAQPSPREFPFIQTRQKGQAVQRANQHRTRVWNQLINEEEWLGDSCRMFSLGEEEGGGDFGFPSVPSQAEGFKEEVRF